LVRVNEIGGYGRAIALKCRQTHSSGGKCIEHFLRFFGYYIKRISADTWGLCLPVPNTAMC